jgi:outer membrane lipoprotein-sorting protein
MKRSLCFCLSGVLILTLMSSPGFGQKAADILDKMIEAQGGRKVLEGIKDATLLGTVEWVEAGGGSMNGTFTQYQKEPNKARRDLEIMGMVRTDAFDGEMAWTNEAGKISEDSGKDAADKKSEAQGYAALLYPEKYGIAYVLKGQEKIEGNDYFVLEKTVPGGTPITQFVDAKTYLIYKIQIPEQATFLSDYRKIDGVMIPHAFTFSGGEGGDSITLHVTKVSFNTNLDDSLFQMKK